MNEVASTPRCWRHTTVRSSALASLGAEIVDVALPARFADLGAVNGRIMSAEAYAALAELVDDNAQPLDQDVRPRVRAGAAISSRDYLLALAERERMKASFNTAIEGVDALLTPTAVTPALPVAVDRSEHDTGDIHALGQLPRPVRGGGTKWLHRRWIAHFAADRLPGLCRTAGVADRLCLSGRARLAPAGSADGGVSQGRSCSGLSCQLTGAASQSAESRQELSKGGRDAAPHADEVCRRHFACGARIRFRVWRRRPSRSRPRRRRLRFVPQANLTLLDPVFTTATVTSNHGYYVFDTLYSVGPDGISHPQMAEGHTVSDDKLTWRIRLREGLCFTTAAGTRDRLHRKHPALVRA